MNATLAGDVERLRQILQGSVWQVPSLETVRLTTWSRRVTDLAALRLDIDTFARDPRCEGWIESIARVRLVRGGSSSDRPDPSPAVDADGHPLNAELAAGDTTLHVRQSHGGWTCTWFRIEGSEPSDGADHQPDDETRTVDAWSLGRQFASDDADDRPLLYRVFLRPTGDGGVEEFAAAFTGFGRARTER